MEFIVILLFLRDKGHEAKKCKNSVCIYLIVLPPLYEEIQWISLKL